MIIESDSNDRGRETCELVVGLLSMQGRSKFHEAIICTQRSMKRNEDTGGSG